MSRNGKVHLNFSNMSNIKGMVSHTATVQYKFCKTLTEYDNVFRLVK